MKTLESAYKRIVVKVGTNVLSNDQGLLDDQIMTSLVQQLAQLKKSGKEVILVSSGAVGAARAIFETNHVLSRVKSRQLLASIGQPMLLNRYLELFHKEGLHAAQILATKEDFRDRHHYLNMRNCFEALMTEPVVPVVNENDVIAIDELMFTDNDELAALVASMINADVLFILTNVDGVYNGDPGLEDTSILSRILPKQKKLRIPFLAGKSSFGRGGMHTKFRVSRKLASTGIDVHIVNGKKSGIIEDILAGKPVGTHFVADKKVSTVKKWIAYQDGDHPRVVINEGACEALLNYKIATSLLPVGITGIHGSFKKGDVVRILNQDGTQIGMGMAQYGSDTAQNYLGKSGKRALIHYDYLYISPDSE